MELEFNDDFFKNKQYKSFIRVGQCFVDIKQTIGFSFINDPTGYIIVQFIYDTGKAINAYLRDRHDFAQFLLELDPFIDDPMALQSIDGFMTEMELSLKETETPNNKTNGKRKRSKNEMDEDN